MSKPPSLVDASKSSLLTLEIVFNLKVRDVMATNLVTAARIDTMRHIQNLMKEHRISGVPIAENGRLFGLVSVDNILRALDFGYIGDTAEGRMTRNLIVLEDNMPLSFAMTWFERYRVGRFPVLDKEEKLVGIVTSGDVMSKLLFEMNSAVNKLEEGGEQQAAAAASQTNAGQLYYREFSIKKFDFEKGGSASSEIRRVLKERGYNPKLIRRAAIASYELEINLVAHSDGGRLSCTIDNNRIEITAKDSGPGIPDVDQALVEGFSTATDWIRSLGFGAGLGLPNVKRASDIFDIRSQMGLGTIVKSIINLTDSE